MSNLTKIAKEGGVTLVGSVLGRSLGFLYIAAITRLVSPNVYGTFTLGLSLVMFSRSIFDLSMHRALDYFLPQYLQNNNHEKAGAMLKLVVLIGVTTTSVAAIFLSQSASVFVELFNEKDLLIILPTLALILPLESLLKILESVFKSMKILKYRTYIKDIIKPTMRILFSVSLVFLGMSFFALVIGHIVALIAALSAGFIFLYRRANWFRSGAISAVQVRPVVSYTIPLVFAGVIYSLVGYIDQFFIGYFLDSSDVAFYQVAFMLAANTLIILRSVTPIFKPTVAGIQNNSSELSTVFKKSTRWITLLTLPIVVTLLVAPELYLSVFFSSEYVVAGSALTALLIGYLINSASGPGGMMLEGLGYTRISLINTSILIIVNTILNILLIPAVGILGAGIATGLALTTISFARLSEIYLIRGIHPYNRDYMKLWVSIFPAAFIGVLIPTFTTTIISSILIPIVVSACYVIALVFISGFTQEDYKVAREIDKMLGTSILGKVVSRGL